MRRRAVLAGVGTAVTAVVAGCLDRASQPSAAESHITEREFEYHEPTESDLSLLRNGPRIEFDADSNRITVRGAMEVGSSDCNRAMLGSAEYDSAADALEIVVINGLTAMARTLGRVGLGSCNGDMSADAYRVDVGFGDRLPGRVEVAERYTEQGIEPIERTTTERYDGRG